MEDKNKYVTSSQTLGVSRLAYYKLLKEAKQGELVRIRRGVYARNDQLADTMIDIDSVVPKGILCLLSAFNIHGFTTSLPQAFHIAVKRGRKVCLPEYPKIELHYFMEKFLDLGVESMMVRGYDIKIYNKERCVCDAIKFRNKIGIDVCAEIVKNYLAMPGRNLSRLSEYARQLRVANILNKYLEIVL